MTTATTTWAQAAMAKSREALPRLQRELDEARTRLDELGERMAAVGRAVATLDPEGDPDLVVAVQVAGETLPPLVAEAEAAVAAAMAARREARAALLPAEESPWSPIRTARQASHRRSDELSGAHLRLGELQRARAAALATTRETSPGGDMVRLAAAEAELRMTDRALPTAREALAAAETAVQQARAEAETLEARARALRLTVLTGEPEEAEAALVELQSLVGDDRSGLGPR